jgi:hypothetical protein
MEQARMRLLNDFVNGVTNDTERMETFQVKVVEKNGSEDKMHFNNPNNLKVMLNDGHEFVIRFLGEKRWENIANYVNPDHAEALKQAARDTEMPLGIKITLLFSDDQPNDQVYKDICHIRALNTMKRLYLMVKYERRLDERTIFKSTDVRSQEVVPEWAIPSNQFGPMLHALILQLRDVRRGGAGGSVRDCQWAIHRLIQRYLNLKGVQYPVIDEVRGRISISTIAYPYYSTIDHHLNRDNVSDIIKTTFAEGRMGDFMKCKAHYTVDLINLHSEYAGEMSGLALSLLNDDRRSRVLNFAVRSFTYQMNIFSDDVWAEMMRNKPADFDSLGHHPCVEEVPMSVPIFDPKRLTRNEIDELFVCTSYVRNLQQCTASLLNVTDLLDMMGKKSKGTVPLTSGVIRENANNLVHQWGRVVTTEGKAKGQIKLLPQSLHGGYMNRLFVDGIRKVYLNGNTIVSELLDVRFDVTRRSRDGDITVERSIHDVIGERGTLPVMCQSACEAEFNRLVETIQLTTNSLNQQLPLIRDKPVITAGAGGRGAGASSDAVAGAVNRRIYGSDQEIEVNKVEIYKGFESLIHLFKLGFKMPRDAAFRETLNSLKP